MNPRDLQILLSNVESNGNINTLLEKGLGFREIASLTEFALVNGLVIYNKSVLKLSEVGIAELSNLRRDSKKLSKEDWIMPEDKSRISQIDMDFIYLPRQDDIP